MPAAKGLSTETVVALYQELGSVIAVARELGIVRDSVRHHLRKAGALKKPIKGGRAALIGLEHRPLPPAGQVKRYICTSAQNNTKVWAPAHTNLWALAEYYDAEILCASYTYNQNAYGRLSVKRGTDKGIDRTLWYAPEVEPLLNASDKDIQLAPGLVWCGSMNTLPTTKDPLAGWETYTGRQSGIFPHARLAMRSVASGKHEPTKFNYTTGTITQLNYIQKAAGLQAQHHHSYGGLLVEVDSEGRWWVRQLNADARGRIYDLDVLAEDGVVWDVAGESVEAISWGDVHFAYIEATVRRLAWGKGGMMDVLHPAHQFMHDTVDAPRNHHDMRDPHRMYEQYITGTDSMEESYQDVVEFLNVESYRPWCTTHVVDSNHDNMTERWLRESDYRMDFPNAIFFLEAQLAKYKSIRDKVKGFHLVEYLLRDRGCNPKVHFLRADEPFVICGDINCGDHGHLGPNGTRATPKSLSKIGRKSNTGHIHSAGIWDGQTVAGYCGDPDSAGFGYAKGPNSHSHSHTITYKNGKRAISTMWDGYWRAEEAA